jgi:single-strand DNA-binding protein
LFVEGRLRLDQWEDKTTHQKKSKLGVVLEGFQFLGGGNRDAAGAPEGGRPAQRPAAPAPAAPAAPADSEAPPIEEDDVPF